MTQLFVVYPQRYVAKTAAYTLVAADDVVDCTSGTFTLTLETAVGVTSRRHTLKNSGTGIITIATTSSQTIDGYVSGALTILPGDAYVLVSNGVNWIII